ncbi:MULTISPECIES: flagellar assembly protein FliH [unclassified Thiobacillus]|uniref:flagellar assembly protein FliH n=1 Tax=unclassified Thiobacillus TaxID=2646513 RepID=UPI00086911B5|nr:MULTISPECIES: flagellar assembly protein FliH [unclassified Thiobacillus]ODV02659.1 MAG: flagellar assembly protein FliH [Thiobacillus sp. SCN 63-57]OJY57895.1 MAG: flagellar assembly protein FliH [Thiobacillus sp. 0-1251]
MSSVLSSVDQAACQPWEMTSFDAHLHPAKQAGHTAVVLPTIEQITAIQEQARQEGYQAGHAEGLAAGREEAAREAARLHDLANTFSTEVAQADEIISQQILDLSIDLARALLKSALAIRPELVIPIVKEAVRYLPVLHQPALLFLNPADALLVKERIGDELEKMGWQLADDGQLEPGGCRVETASNQIDASLPTRWQRLTAALSKNSDWLAA